VNFEGRLTDGREMDGQFALIGAAAEEHLAGSAKRLEK